MGTGRGAELGVLFRKGEALQLLKDARVVAADIRRRFGYGMNIMHAAPLALSVPQRGSRHGVTWGDMHIPRRKFRYTKVDGEVFFVVFNTDRTQAGIMTKDSVKKERVVNKFNRLSRLHEDYISVPVKEIIWV